MTELLRSLAGRAALPAAAQHAVVDVDPKRLGNGPVARMLCAAHPVDTTVLERLARAGTNGSRGGQLASSRHLRPEHVALVADHAGSEGARRTLLLTMCAHADEAVQRSALDLLGTGAVVRKTETRRRTVAAFAVWGGTAVRHQLLQQVGDEVIRELASLLAARGSQNGHYLRQLHEAYGPMIPTAPSDPLHLQVAADLLATGVALTDDVEKVLSVCVTTGRPLPFAVPAPRPPAQQQRARQVADDTVTVEQMLSHSARGSWLVYPDYRPATITRLRDLLTERLTTEADWRLFAVLSGGFAGSLGDLLDTIGALTTPERPALPADCPA